MSLPSNIENESKIRQFFSFPGMDSESAIWQLVKVYTNPKAVHRIIRTHRHTRGHWSRDDPSFLILENLLVP